MCTLQDFKSHQVGSQEIIVFTTTAMTCKYSVMSKQVGGRLTSVCAVVWITLYIKSWQYFLLLVPAEIQLRLRDHFQFINESDTFHTITQNKKSVSWYAICCIYFRLNKSDMCVYSWNKNCQLTYFNLWTTHSASKLNMWWGKWMKDTSVNEKAKKKS